MKHLIAALAHPSRYRWLALRPWRRHSLVLATAGLAYCAIGFIYVITEPTDSRQSSLRLAYNIAPEPAWGTVFITVGLLAVLSGRWPPASEKWGYTTLSGLSALWGAFYLLGVPLGGTASSLSGAAVWFLMTFVWWAISGLDNPVERLHRPAQSVREV